MNMKVFKKIIKIVLILIGAACAIYGAYCAVYAYIRKKAQEEAEDECCILDGTQDDKNCETCSIFDDCDSCDKCELCDRCQEENIED